MEIVIFPTQIEIEGKKILLLKGFVEKFQAFLDLKRGVIEVRGFVEDTFFNYEIRAQNSQIKLIGKKGIRSRLLAKTKSFHPLKGEKLHFGVHKKQLIERIFERNELTETLPLWFQLAQAFPPVKDQKVALFDHLEKLKKQKNHDLIGKELTLLFCFLFPNRLVPKSEDILHFGFSWKFVTKRKDFAFLLLQKSKTFIRSLFIEEGKQSLHILPHLLPEFVFGRFDEVETSLGSLDIRFSKKKPFSVSFQPKQTKAISLHFPKNIKSCRIRESKKQKGTRAPLPLTILFEKEKTYLIDRFEK